MRRRSAALGAASLLVLGLMSAQSASAAFTGVQLPGSTFEIDTDANLRVDDAGNTDWASPGAGNVLNVKQDKASGAGDDSFGNGTKEDTAVPSVIDGSIPPNKSDLKSFGVLQEGNRFLHLFWARVQNPSGTTNMDFEFNTSTVLSVNGVTPVRTAGDLLITYDLSNGGTRPTLSKRTWTGSQWGPAVSLSGNAVGSVNTSSVASADSITGVGALTPFTFGEASIDLTSIFPTGQCASFGSAYLKSRSSDAFNAAIKDFIAPQAVNVSNCGSVTLHKQDDAGTSLAGATFTLYKDNPTVGGTRTAADTITALSCTTTLPTGDCTIADVPFGDYWVVETVTPPNHGTAPDQALSVAPSGNTPAGTLTFVNPRLTGSVVVEKVDESGDPLAGAGFTITGTGVDTAIPLVDGVARFCVDGLLFGDYTVTESVTPNGYTGSAPAKVTVSGASTCAQRVGTGADVVVTNQLAPGTIEIAKTNDAGAPLAGAGFTLYPDLGTVGTYEPLVDAPAVDTATTDADGLASFANVDPGSYCVVETTTPSGYATVDPRCVEVEVGPAAGAGDTVELEFVNERLHRVIVLVCHEGTDTLESSKVTVDGETKDSLASTPGGFTETQLCDLGGASFGGRDDSDVAVAVDIP